MAGAAQQQQLLQEASAQKSNPSHNQKIALVTAVVEISPYDSKASSSSSPPSSPRLWRAKEWLQVAVGILLLLGVGAGILLAMVVLVDHLKGGDVCQTAAVGLRAARGK